MLRGTVRVGLDACLDAELDTVIGADWYERVEGRSGSSEWATRASS